MVHPDKCIIRKIHESDYENYIVMINEFRETYFTKEQFVDTLWYLNPFSEIWVIEYENDIIATGTILYEKKFIHNIQFFFLKKNSAYEVNIIEKK